MISIYFPEIEYYNEEENVFKTLEAMELDFEYSLKSILVWESRWKIPYLTSELRIDDPRFIDFLLCMTDSKKLDISRMTIDVIKTLVEYIRDSATATTFNTRQNDSESNAKTYTAEEIYAIMFMNQIPLEWENRNLNNLLVILRVIAYYNKPPKKMSRQEVLSENARINAERKKQYGTKG